MTELREEVARAVRKACTAYTMETPRQWEIAADAAIAIVIERAAKVAGEERRSALAIKCGHEPEFHKIGREIATAIRNLAPETKP